jgi:flagellar biosynthesis/type III secretory pathway chaperone
MNHTVDPKWVLAETLLQHLVLLERQEQEAILQRKPNELPAICRQIDELADQLASCGTPAGDPPPAVVCLLAQVRELAGQNHVLVESHLRFLREVFAIVFPDRRKSQTYDALGRMAASISQAGMLVNAHT